MINSPLEQFHLLKYIRLFLMGCCIQFFMKELPLYMNIEWLKLTLFFESIFLIILVVILLNSFFAISLVKITLFSCEKIFLTSFFNITTLLLAFNSFRHTPLAPAFRYNGIEGGRRPEFLKVLVNYVTARALIYLKYLMNKKDKLTGNSNALREYKQT